MPSTPQKKSRDESLADLGEDLALTAECLLLDEAIEKILSSDAAIFEPAKRMAGHHARLLYVRAMLKKGKAVSARTVKIIFNRLLPELEQLLRTHAFGTEEHKYRLLQEIIAIREKRLAAEEDSKSLPETTGLVDSAIKIHEAWMRGALGNKYGEFERKMKKIEQGFQAKS